MTQQTLFWLICSVNQVQVALYQVSLFLFIFILHPEPSEEEPEKQAEGRGGEQPAVPACQPCSQTTYWEQERRWGWFNPVLLLCFFFRTSILFWMIVEIITITIYTVPQKNKTKNIENGRNCICRIIIFVPVQIVMFCVDAFLLIYYKYINIYKCILCMYKWLYSYYNVIY